MEAGSSGELSQSELIAFDLLLAQMEESGQTGFSASDIAFTTPAITAVARATPAIVRVTINITPAIIGAPGSADRVDEAEALRRLAEKKEITLDELVEFRNQLG
jgi:hypothetical protein